MENSLLIKLFASFTRRDYRKIRIFLCSPYFNQRKDVVLLFDVLAQSNTTTIDPQKAFNQIYPKEIFNIKKWRHLMSFLLQLLKKYLAIEHLQADGLQMQIALCQEAKERNMTFLMEKELKVLAKSLSVSDKRHARFHYQNYLMYAEQYDVSSRKSRTGKLPLQQWADELSVFYMSEILRIGCNMLIQKRMNNRAYSLPLIEKVISIVEKNIDAQPPALLIYYHSYCSLEDTTKEEHYFALKQLIKEQLNRFPIEEMKGIIKLAINFCIKNLNSGRRSYIREAFDLYQYGLDNDIFLEKGFLSGFDYKNIMRLAIGLQEYEWAYQFLNEYKNYLPPNQRENTFQYNQAFLLFQQQRYQEAMPLLQQIDIKDVFNNMDARRMLLRIYFELEEFDALDSLLDSFKVFIHRQKDIGYHKQNYNNLIRIMKRMLRSNLDDQAIKTKIRHSVQQTEQVAEKEWLLKQLA